MATARGAAAARHVTLALPVPLDRTYSYLIPDGLTIAPGMRVLAPWGRRRLVGLALEISGDPPAGVEPEKLRAIELALDAEPILDATLLELARWTAAYYQAPLGETLRCALPPASELRERRRLRLTAAGRQQLEAAAQAQGVLFGEAEARDLLRAAARGVALAGALRRHGARAIRQALARAWLRLEIDAALAAPEPTIRTWRLAEGASGAEPRGTAQRMALELLRGGGGEMDAAALAAQVS
ncbi:MAG: hypothetical protein ACRD2H_08890, partial [Terriglobales bacterium]